MQTEKVTFQVLFTSDIHGAFRNYDYMEGKEIQSGFSRIATAMKREKENFEGITFICDCGDSIQGNGTFELIKKMKEEGKYKPYPLFSAFQSVGYDMVVLGNHEFNFGLEEMYASFEGYEGIKLCGNVFDENGDYLKGFVPYCIMQVPNGPRVAFIGMVSPNIDVWDQANITNAKIRSANAAGETRKIIDQLKKEDLADLFIAIQHMDEIQELDREGSGGEEVIEMNPELILFIGAHYHKEKGKESEQHVLCNQVKFVENLNAARTYGRAIITATCKDGKWAVEKKTGEYEESDVKTDIISPAPDTPDDPEVLAVTNEAHAYLKKYMQKTLVGWLPDAPLIPQPDIKGTHRGVLESNALIYLVCKVMFEYTQADIVATALNSYTANCSNVQLTAGSISQIYVYDNNTLYKLSMTGAQILQWMEWSYAFFGTVDLETDLTISYGKDWKVYLYDQFSGINYTVDLTQPAGQRIHVLNMKNGGKFNPEKEYVVAVTNYRATTNLLRNSSAGIFKPGQPTARLIQADITSGSGKKNMLDLIAEYISNRKDETIYRKCEENWKFINLDWKQEWRNLAIELINNGTMPYDFQSPVTIEQVKELLNSLK